MICELRFFSACLANTTLQWAAGTTSSTNRMQRRGPVKSARPAAAISLDSIRISEFTSHDDLIIM